MMPLAFVGAKAAKSRPLDGFAFMLGLDIEIRRSAYIVLPNDNHNPFELLSNVHSFPPSLDHDASSTIHCPDPPEMVTI